MDGGSLSALHLEGRPIIFADYRDRLALRSRAESVAKVVGMAWSDYVIRDYYERGILTR